MESWRPASWIFLSRPSFTDSSRPLATRSTYHSLDMLPRVSHSPLHPASPPIRPRGDRGWIAAAHSAPPRLTSMPAHGLLVDDLLQQLERRVHAEDQESHQDDGDHHDHGGIDLLLLRRPGDLVLQLRFGVDEE